MDFLTATDPPARSPQQHNLRKQQSQIDTWSLQTFPQLKYSFMLGRELYCLPRSSIRIHLSVYIALYNMY